MPQAKNSNATKKHSNASDRARLKFTEIVLSDKLHDTLLNRCADLKEMNERLVLAIDGWRQSGEAQRNELKALRLATYFVTDPKTMIGQLRAEVSELRTCVDQAEQEKLLLQAQVAALKRFHKTETHDYELRIKELSRKRKPPAPKNLRKK